LLNTLLFDLDGTLLPFDPDPFMTGYFQGLSPKLTAFVDPKDVPTWILKAMKSVVENESPHLTNLEKFRKALFDGRLDHEVPVWTIFEQFYENEFETLQSLTKPSPISREICRTAVDKGYRLALATNPIFPELATRARMRWAGISEIPFQLITTMENTHFCKPNPKYYLEVVDRLEVNAVECIMIGNDVQEDGVAAHVGMQTYLVKDCIIDRQLGSFHFDHEGSLQDVLAFVQSLPGVSSHPV
jgi:FMN phosphatase YigB (HAD superfamily)